MQLVKVLIYWQRVHVFPDSESKTVVWMLVDPSCCNTQSPKGQVSEWAVPRKHGRCHESVSVSFQFSFLSSTNMTAIPPVCPVHFHLSCRQKQRYRPMKQVCTQRHAARSVQHSSDWCRDAEHAHTVGSMHFRNIVPGSEPASCSLLPIWTWKRNILFIAKVQAWNVQNHESNTKKKAQGKTNT